VQLSDIHHGPWVPLSFVDRMVKITNALDPDLILLNGDYVSSSSRFIKPVVQRLANLRARIGVLGVLGNHDWWEGVGETRDHFREVDIPLIDNSRMFVSPERKLVKDARNGLCVAGVGDYWEDEIDFVGALKGVPDEMPRLLLSHNPDVAEVPELANHEYRVDLMLSGHTHGGQVRLPLLGTPIVPSSYGQKYAQGLVQGPGCQVYITRGIGLTVLPVRLGVPPEITLIELTTAEEHVA
jgi:predicted MPP superfamily phosphohydrolase